MEKDMKKEGIPVAPEKLIPVRRGQRRHMNGKFPTRNLQQLEDSSGMLSLDKNRDLYNWDASYVSPASRNGARNEAHTCLGCPSNCEDLMRRKEDILSDVPNSESCVCLASSSASTGSEKNNARKRGNNGTDLNRKPYQRPKLTRLVINEGKAECDTKSHAPKPAISQSLAPKSSTPVRAANQESPCKNMKYIRRKGLKASTKFSEIFDEQAVAKSCKKALMFNMGKQQKEQSSCRDVGNTKRIDAYPEYDGKQSRRALHINFSLNQVRNEGSVKKIIHHGQSQSKPVHKVTASRYLLRSTAVRSVRQVTSQKKRKGIGSSLKQNRNLHMILPMLGQRRAVIGDPELFECVLISCPVKGSERKASKGRDPLRNIASPRSRVSAEGLEAAVVGQLIESAIQKLECLHIDNECRQLAAPEKNSHRADVPLTVHFDPPMKRKSQAKVDLDSETMRVWKLLMENDGSRGVEDADSKKEKWWEQQRELFRGRVDSFIARMHLIQGNRRFSSWKGSVVDSIVGVFLAQNVSDHLSSSAFMSLAARFPLKSTSKCKECYDTSDVACSQESAGSNIAGNGKESAINAQELFYFTTEQYLSRRFSETRDETLATKSTRAILDPLTEAKASPIQSFEVLLDIIRRTTTVEPCCTFKIPTSLSYNIGKDDLSCAECLVNGDVSSSGVVNWKTASSSKNFVYIRYSNNRSSKVLRCQFTSDSDSLNCLGDLENKGIKDLRNVGKFLGCMECDQSETGYQKNAKSRARETITVEPHVSLSKCQVSPGCSQLSEVIAGENLDSSIKHQCEGKVSLRYEATSRGRKSKFKKKKENTIDWDDLRRTYSTAGVREAVSRTTDSLDWGAVRSATIGEIADIIKGRGMQNVLAEHIKEFLDRTVDYHGSLDLEWLREVPPEKAKEYLLGIKRLGMKSVECVRLLALHHHAFPVDTNVGRVVVRLGWVPLQPLSEEVQIHLLNQYPLLETIQKYLWPRLCTLDQRTLYELHYQMITFGKVFCTKRQPNCNACPMKGDCRHFASEFASARLALPGSKGETTVTSKIPVTRVKDSVVVCPPSTVFSPEYDISDSGSQTQTCEPVTEIPRDPRYAERQPCDIEDFFSESQDEIPAIRLDSEEPKEALPTIKDIGYSLPQKGDMSKALVTLCSETASTLLPKLKYVSRLRTVHRAYELPDSHPLLEGLNKREPDDPCPYLLVIWTPGEMMNSSEESPEPEICMENTCFQCSDIKEQNFERVFGTIMIPCRTGTKGSFPLNGTYFQVNEVFADHQSSHHPIFVPRAWIWNLTRRNLYCGTSAASIFTGLSTAETQSCFWKGFICVRGFDRTTGAPQDLADRLHRSTMAPVKRKRNR